MGSSSLKAQFLQFSYQLMQLRLHSTNTDLLAPTSASLTTLLEKWGDWGALREKASQHYQIISEKRMTSTQIGRFLSSPWQAGLSHTPLITMMTASYLHCTLSTGQALQSL